MNAHTFARALSFPSNCVDLLFGASDPNLKTKFSNYLSSTGGGRRVEIVERLFSAICGENNPPSAATAIINIAARTTCVTDGFTEYRKYPRGHSDGGDIVDDIIKNNDDWLGLIFVLRRTIPEDLLAAASFFHQISNPTIDEFVKEQQHQVLISRLPAVITDNIGGQSQLGDYHVHAGAALRFSRLFPPFLPSQLPQRKSSDRKTQHDKNINGKPKKDDFDVRSLYSLATVHSVAKWMTALALAKKCFEPATGDISKYFVYLPENTANWLISEILKINHFPKDCSTDVYSQFIIDVFREKLYFNDIHRESDETGFWNHFAKLFPMSDPNLFFVYLLARVFSERPKAVSSLAYDPFQFWSEIWLRSRCQLFQTLTQQANHPGLTNFTDRLDRYRSLRSLTRSTRVNPEDFLTNCIEAVSPNNELKWIEFRSLLNGGADLSRECRQAAKSCFRLLDREPAAPNVCFTVSLSKKSRLGRFSHKAREFWNQIDAMARLFEQDPGYRFLFRALDVCSHERAVPNWIVVWAFRVARSKLSINLAGYPDMRFTAHAGEEFVWPGQGLRFIDEVARSLDQNDRIGHGIALGLNYDKWLKYREPQPTTIGEWLDDLGWAYHTLNSSRNTLQDLHSANVNGILVEIENAFVALTNDENVRNIWNSIIGMSVRDFATLYCERFNMSGSLKSVFSRKYAPRADFLSESSITDIFPDKSVENNPTLRNLSKYLLACEKLHVVDYSVPDKVSWMKDAFDMLKYIVRQRLIRKGIIVEACPSSNLLVAEIGKDMKDHPIFDFQQPNRSDQELPTGLRFSVNSDDPIIFASDVVSEFALLDRAMTANNISFNDRVDWLSNIIKTGYESRFHVDLEKNGRYGKKFLEFRSRIMER